MVDCPLKAQVLANCSHQWSFLFCQAPVMIASHRLMTPRHREHLPLHRKWLPNVLPNLQGAARQTLSERVSKANKFSESNPPLRRISRGLNSMPLNACPLHSLARHLDQPAKLSLPSHRARGSVRSAEFLILGLFPGQRFSSTVLKGYSAPHFSDIVFSS